MRIATWNLNNRVGYVPFKLHAAAAAASTGAEIIVFTEYYPKRNPDAFVNELSGSGLSYQLISREPAGLANRVLIASARPIEFAPIEQPDFDEQRPSNLVAFRVCENGLTVLGIRIPWYTQERLPRVLMSWDWLERTATVLMNRPALIIGDLNVKLHSPRSRGGEHFRRLLQQGWKRAEPTGSGSWCSRSGLWTEIDHALCSPLCRFTSAEYISSSKRFALGGNAKDCISDHVALVVDCEVFV